MLSSSRSKVCHWLRIVIVVSSCLYVVSVSIKCCSFRFFLLYVITMSKRSKNPSPVMYFTEAVDEAIVRYLAETNQEKRNQIFNNFIYHPFYKIAENILNTFKFSYFDDHSTQHHVGLRLAHDQTTGQV